MLTDTIRCFVVRWAQQVILSFFLFFLL